MYKLQITSNAEMHLEQNLKYLLEQIKSQQAVIGV